MRYTNPASRVKEKQVVTKFYTSWDELPLILDTSMLSRLLGISDQRIRLLCREGQIPAFQIINEKTSHWKFEKSKIRAWLENRNETNLYTQDTTKKAEKR